MSLDERFTTAPGNVEFYIPLQGGIRDADPEPGEPSMTLKIQSPVMLATLGALKVLIENEDTIIEHMMQIASERLKENPEIIPQNPDYTDLRHAAQSGVDILELDDNDSIGDEFMSFLETYSEWEKVQTIIPINDDEVHAEFNMPGFKSYWLLMSSIRRGIHLEAFLLNKIKEQE